MNLFEVYATIRIITPSESDYAKLLVLVYDDGSFPSVHLSNNQNIEDRILQELSNIFYPNDLNTILLSKNISSINSTGNKLEIIYNFIAHSTVSKIGSFIPFDKNSIELYRMAKNHTL